MSEANGEFIAFLDSDDFWSPQKLDVQLSALRKAPGCRWSYTAFTMVDANGEPLATECTRRWDSHSGGVFKRLLGEKLAITTPTVIAARRLIEQAGGFRVGQLLYEDYDLWSRLALLSEAQAIDMPLTCVRKHAEHYGRTVRGPAAWWRAKWRWSVARAVLGLYFPHRLRGRRLSGSKPTDTDETKPA